MRIGRLFEHFVMHLFADLDVNVGMQGFDLGAKMPYERLQESVHVRLEYGAVKDWLGIGYGRVVALSSFDLGRRLGDGRGLLGLEGLPAASDVHPSSVKLRLKGSMLYDIPLPHVLLWSAHWVLRAHEPYQTTGFLELRVNDLLCATSVSSNSVGTTGPSRW